MCSYRETWTGKLRWNVISSTFSDFLDYKNFDAGTKINDFLIECSSAKTKLSIETLMEEMEAVAPEKLEFENRDKSDLIAFFRNFWTISDLTHRWKQIGFFSKKIPSSKSVKFLIQDLMEIIEPVVAEKSVRMIMIALSGNFVQSRLWRQAQRLQFSVDYSGNLHNFWLRTLWSVWATSF